MPINLGETAFHSYAAELQSLGLDEKQARVYLALLQLGEVGTSHIAKATGLHTQFIYAALEGLEKMGLAQHVVKQGRKRFSSKHPHTLVRIAEHQRQTATLLSAELEKVTALPKEQRFEIFQGDKSYIDHEFEMLEEAPSGCQLLLICGITETFLDVMEGRVAEYDKMRIKKNVLIRYLGSTGQRDALEHSAATRQMFTYRLLPGTFTGEVSTNIWPMAICFTMYSQPVLNFTHHNEAIAKSYAQFFEVLWKMARP